LPLSLVVFDPDGSKRRDDTLGHDAGDAVLVEVACLIESLTCARATVWGGERLVS
jgi:GGDEF domain-containing protein